MTPKLFDTDQPPQQWNEFSADGFAAPAAGVIFRSARPPCCGVPLGGLSTGCIDVDARGVYGFSSIFNPSSDDPDRELWRFNRRTPVPQPLLGLAVGGQVWVLAHASMTGGGRVEWCAEPHNAEAKGRPPVSNPVMLEAIEGVGTASEIHYWGHYPVADLEFETSAPVSAGLRAWAPFIPGDLAASNTPAAVFEVRLCNTSGQTQTGALAFNFPGPAPDETPGQTFSRTLVQEDFNGIAVSANGQASYVLGVLDGAAAHFGAGLHAHPAAWAQLAERLPKAPFREVAGEKVYLDGSSSAAVDFSLAPGESAVVRFLLAWHVPVWEGARSPRPGQALDTPIHQASLSSPWAGDRNVFSQMYAVRYGSAIEVARRMALDHAALLTRVLAWQSAIYAEAQLPAWLRDSLVNNLALIAEDSHWAQPRAPLGDWCFPLGVFALNESPRGCPHIACIPCDWYGNLPIVFFFPELARTTLRAFKQYQKPDGEIPFALGRMAQTPDLATPEYFWQVSLNGMCYVDMVDRLWQRTGDMGALTEFYDSVKQATTFTMNLRGGPGGVISMPEIGGMEWFEFGDWAGMAAHMGGLRLAQLRMAERMAEAMGDAAYAEQCRAWLADGTRAMEDEMWTGGYYLNYFEKETGKRSDDVMAYQLDGQWAAQYHGLPEVFRPERARAALQTIRACNVALTPDVGAANFARPDGTPLPADSAVAYYGRFAMFPPELLVLAMTYIYAGEREFGLDLARRMWENLALRQGHPWDLPNLVSGDTGRRLFGTDYYQNMMLWALPAALAGHDLRASAQPGELIDRVLRAGEGQ